MCIRDRGFIYRLEELDPSKNYYVYCKAGGRSAQACSIMQQMGFKNVYNPVSYTHLDVYKRQTLKVLGKFLNSNSSSTTTFMGVATP